MDEDLDTLFDSATVAVPGEQIADASEWMRSVFLGQKAWIVLLLMMQIRHERMRTAATGLIWTPRTTRSSLVSLVE